MTEEKFERFLNWLDTDRETAAQKYEKLRRSLVIYFAKRQCAAAEDLADLVLNAAMEHLLKQTALLLDKPLPYVFGIARNVYRQHINKQFLTDGEKDLRLLPDRSRFEENSEKEQIVRCLRQCLQKLKRQDRRTFVFYYLKDTGAKDEHRLRQAAELGMTINALRLRMMRLRESLRDCISSCLQDAAA